MVGERMETVALQNIVNVCCFDGGCWGTSNHLAAVGLVFRCFGAGRESDALPRLPRFVFLGHDAPVRVPTMGD